MASPTLTSAPTADELTAIDCLFTRAARITEISRTCGTLTPQLAALRRTTLKALRADFTPDQIAERLNLSGPRISQLTSEPKTKHALAAQEAQS